MSDRDNRPENKRRESSVVGMFNAREIAKTLTEVSVDHIKNEGRNIETRWYHSPNDADLFFWRDDQKNIIKQQVSFYGQLLEWNMVEGLRTGVVIESQQAADMNSPLIHFDQSPQRKTVEQGVEIVEEMTNLDPEIKRRIIRNFR